MVRSALAWCGIHETLDRQRSLPLGSRPIISSPPPPGIIDRPCGTRVDAHGGVQRAGRMTAPPASLTRRHRW
jgi:hypothetical protein